MSGYVTHEREVEEEREPGDTAAVRRTIGPEAGAERLEQRVIRFGAGRSRPRSPGPHKQEILYVASGSGTLRLDGAEHELVPDTGVFVVAGETWEVENPGPDELVLVSVVAPQERAPNGGRRVTGRFRSSVPTRSAPSATSSTRNPAASR